VLQSDITCDAFTALAGAASTALAARAAAHTSIIAVKNLRIIDTRLWGIALAALGVRLLYMFVIARAPVGVGGDAGFYQSAASQIAHGHFYYRVIFGQAFKTAEHPPLYSLLLSVGSLLGGDSLQAHRILSCVIGAFAVLLIGFLARTLGGRRAGLIAAAIAALYPPFVTADALVMSEPLFTLTVAAALLVAIHLRRRPTLLGSVALGVTIALAALTRAEGLLLIPLLGWPASQPWMRGGAQGSTGARGSTGAGRSTSGPLRPAGARRSAGPLRLLVLTVAAVVVIAPWMVRNGIVFHRFLFAADANTLIAGANCHDTYYGHDIGWWSLDCLAHGRKLAQLQVGDASTGPAVDYAGDHLGRLALVMPVRVLRTFDLFQPLRQGNREVRRKWVDVVGLVFYFPLLVLAAIGLFRARSLRAAGARSVLLAPVLMVVIASALGWGIGRFRIGADVSIVVLAALALTSWRRVERGRVPPS
jgi:hypothetical protein